MPNAGVKFYSARRRYRFGGTGNVDINPEGIGGGILARGTARYTEDKDTISAALIAYAYSQKAGSGPVNSTKTVYGIFSEPLGIDPAQEFIQAGLFTQTLEGYVDVYDMLIEQVGNAWRFKCSDIKLLRGSTVLYSSGAKSLDGAANYLAPAAAPFGFGWRGEWIPYLGISIPL